MVTVPFDSIDNLCFSMAMVLPPPESFDEWNSLTWLKDRRLGILTTWIPGVLTIFSMASRVFLGA